MNNMQHEMNLREREKQLLLTTPHTGEPGSQRIEQANLNREGNLAKLV
jgi:hypothetical protein